MPVSQPSVQPAAERRASKAALRALIAKFSPEHARLVAAARRALRTRLPTAHEVVYEYRGFFVISYSPSGRGYEGVMAVRGGADGVTLYFNRGKELPDPEKLLRGSGNMARSVRLESASTLARPAVAALIEAAIAHNRVPFARDGNGSVTIRSTSANKRPRRASTARPAAARKRKSG